MVDGPAQPPQVVAPEGLQSAYSGCGDRELRQGEIIAGLTQWVFDPKEGVVNDQVHAYAVVASQDCDLLQDFDGRNAGAASQLNGVLLYEARPAGEVRAEIKGSDIWKRIRQNKDERYHALGGSGAYPNAEGIPLPDLIVDFRRFFTLSATEIHRQIIENQAHRWCRLEMPFREHFQARAAFYLLRVGLPFQHEVA